MDSAFLVHASSKATGLIFNIGSVLLLSSLLVGVTIAIIQSVTQIQDPTLTFVPKAIVVAYVFWIYLPTISAQMSEFVHECFGFVQ